MDSEHPETSSFEPIGRADIVLGVLTLPLLLFVVMFAVTGTTELLNTRRARLRAGLVLLAVEVVIVVAIVAALQ